MLIVCKTCASSYHIPREILGENGCRLRCASCGDLWAVSPAAILMGDAPIVEGERLPPEALYAPRQALHLRFASLSNQPGGPPLGKEARPRKSWSAFGIRQSGAGARLALAILLILGCVMAGVATRGSIVKAAPNTARIFAMIGLPVNLRGLALDNVRTNSFDLGDRRVLVVEGAIVNLFDSATETPDLRIALRGVDKRELYVWMAPAPKARLGPNEQIAFRTRLAAPPDGVNDVLVKFASAGDKLSPTKDGL
jgi:predicted Zn finger-like uncharacterized protein